MTSGLSFAVLGAVRAWRDGSEIDLGSPQQRAVLAVLLLRAGEHVRAEELIDALWPEDPPRSALGTIRTYVYRLRRLLGQQVIRSAGTAYIFHRPGDALDAARFKRSVELARRARADGDVTLAERYLGEGLALWQGTALADVPGRFAETQRALLEELRLTATEDSADDSLALGRHAEVIPGLVALTEEHPYRERPRALLMLGLYRAGRQAAALAVFDRVRQLFAAELGIDPGPQLRDLHLRILNADPALMELPPASPAPADAEPGAADPGAGPPGTADGATAAGSAAAREFRVRPAQLPPDLPSFAGRTADIEFVAAGFTDEPGPATVTIIAGMAGVGKTTLAVHAAHLLADRFPDGQLYVDLRGFDASGMAMSPQDAVRQLLAGLEVPPERVPAHLEAQVGLYRSVLAGRRVLIVLDNARDAGQVRPLLPGARDCRVLVTSRDQLRSLIATDGARLVGLSPLSGQDARRTLVRRLGAPRVDAESEAAERIIALCAGLPLTLSLVAARAATRPSHSLSAIADELARSGNSLNALADSDLAVDARASLSLSYHALSSEAARLLRLSSVHPGAEVSRDAIASLAGVAAADAAAGLEELERVHLMSQPEPSRYATHDLVRDYAAELATTDPAAELAAARMRMLEHYRQSATMATLVLASDKRLGSGDDSLPGVTVADFTGIEEASRWFARTYPVLRVVFRQTVELGLPEHTWQLARALDPFHDRYGRWQDMENVHIAGLAAAEKLANPAMQAHSHRRLGQAFRLLGDLDRAMDHFERAQRLYTELGDRTEQAMNLHNFVAVFQARNSPREAMSHVLRALELSREAQDRRLQAIALNNLGWLHGIDGDHAAAIGCAGQAAALAEEIGSVNLCAQTRYTLGQCHYWAGDYERAAANLAESVTVFHDQHDPYREADALHWFAIAQARAGNTPSARRAWQRALVVLSDLGKDLPAFEAYVTDDASTRS
jgi:DNA-binding SARP family transcriptional activator/tetratricopeptide (TPR) repeat protein